MATFTWTPDFPIDADTEPRLFAARFGDGYEQRVLDGLNAIQPAYSVRFMQRTLAEADAIETFLRSNAGLAFDWTPPGGSAGKYVARKWSRSRGNVLFASIVTSFEQVPA